ncbi:MAG: prolyl-tRNA synthetase associated domain-containing protein [Pseudomonadota bacterium]|nr:prolyl-tRNA synthetase associated domain-containing protein [Pseudomonadota bacterium]
MSRDWAPAVDPRERFVLAQLDAHGVPYTVHRHPPLRTVEDAKQLRGDIEAAHVKNLFLRDKREQMWVVTVLEDRPIDIRALRAHLNAYGSVSFGSPDRLRRVLGIEPGSVSPLAIVNAPVIGSDAAVRLVLDRGLERHAYVGVHPLHNEATVRIAVSELVRFLEAIGRAPMWLEL